MKQILLALLVLIGLASCLELNAPVVFQNQIDLFKHLVSDFHIPTTGPFENWLRNSFLLASANIIQFTCYLNGFLPLIFDNDAAQFYNECFSMWTLHINFYRYNP